MCACDPQYAPGVEHVSRAADKVINEQLNGHGPLGDSVYTAANTHKCATPSDELLQVLRNHAE